MSIERETKETENGNRTGKTPMWEKRGREEARKQSKYNQIRKISRTIIIMMISTDLNNN